MLAKEYEIVVEGRAYLLRPDTPSEGSERPQRPGETADELSCLLYTSDAADE